MGALRGGRAPRHANVVVSSGTDGGVRALVAIRKGDTLVGVVARVRGSVAVPIGLGAASGARGGQGTGGECGESVLAFAAWLDGGRRREAV